jgi:rubredoxin
MPHRTDSPMPGAAFDQAGDRIPDWPAEPNRRKDSMKVWQCMSCGYIYNEAAGDPEHGIAPGTPWAEILAAWQCPTCGETKASFEMVDITP